MKTPRTLLATLALLVGFTSAFAQLNIPAADGSDLGFTAPSGLTTIDLSQAITGDALTYSNSGANQGKGIYDPVRWVVVFKYSSVNVQTGATVKFINHPTHAPVVWLVQGVCNILGTVNLDGANGGAGVAGLVPAEPGPGGFRGGPQGAPGNGPGFGPGGGGNSTNGAYDTAYGNPEIRPLIGGSGGGSRTSFGSGSGGGGGGAFLIACPNAITFTGGAISALGGGGGISGSGGAIKLIAHSVVGAGNLNAATTGRVRIEANTLSASITSVPVTVTVPPGAGATPMLFPSPSSSTVKIVSVDGKPLAPANLDDPQSDLATSPDVQTNTNGTVAIVIQTNNFATNGVVALRITDKYGSLRSVSATFRPGGTNTQALWDVSTTLNPGFCALQVRATQP